VPERAPVRLGSGEDWRAKLPRPLPRVCVVATVPGLPGSDGLACARFDGGDLVTRLFPRGPDAHGLDAGAFESDLRESLARGPGSVRPDGPAI
jgi:hypothetical protein